MIQVTQDTIRRIMNDADNGSKSAFDGLQRYYKRQGVNFFYIPASKVATLQKNLKSINDNIEKINRASAKAHAKALANDPNFDGEAVQLAKATLALSSPRMLRRDGVMFLGHDAQVVIHDLKVHGTWTFAADVDINWQSGQERSNVVHRATSYTGPLPDDAWFAERECSCDHCGLNRLRKKVFVLVNDEGAFMLVGKSCVKDFLVGVTGQRLLSQLQLEKQVKQSLGIYRITEDIGVNAVRFAAAHRAGNNAWISWALASRNNASNPDWEEHITEARTALRWLADLNPNTDKLRNLKAAYTFNGILKQHVGIASELWIEYDRAHKQPAQSQASTEQGVWRIERRTFSGRKNAYAYRVYCPYDKPFIASLKAMFGRGRYWWSRESKCWIVWPTKESQIPELRELCMRSFEDKPAEPDKPKWHKDRAGLYTVALPATDKRFVVRCVAVLDAKHIYSMSLMHITTYDAQTAREAYKQAMWCLSHPES